MIPPRKVVFMIGAMSGGGAEKVMLQILHYLDRRRFTPYLVLFRKAGAFMEAVPPDVKVHSLVDCKYFLYRWLIYFRYKKYISILKPDVVVSFMWYPNFIALLGRYCCRAKHKIIVSERNTLAFTPGMRLVGLVRRWGTWFLYPTADRVVALTQQMKQEMLARTPVRSNSINVIHNPVDIQALEKKSKEPLELPFFDASLPFILSIGKLTIQKGFGHLIRAFARVATRQPAHLVILGEGKERYRLQRLINRLGIKERVHMPGFVKNPYKYLARSTVFVLSSIYEGFPNVLLEALASGVPAIATRCPTGPEEIITDGVDGILVSPADELALADAIKKLLLDESLRKRLGKSGKKRAEDFNVEKIVRQYEQVIEDVCRASVAD